MSVVVAAAVVYGDTMAYGNEHRLATYSYSSSSAPAPRAIAVAAEAGGIFNNVAAPATPAANTKANTHTQAHTLTHVY